MNARLTQSPLFTGVRLNRLDLPNRYAVAPMTRISATPQGVATDIMVRYYERFAKGGFGLVVTEGIYTDQAYSQGYREQPGLSDLEQAKAWRYVVDAVHAAGGKIFAQLMHAGALAQGNRFRSETAGPSAIQPKGTQMAFYRGDGPYPIPRAMTQNEIAEAIEGFSRAALLATEVAGFDGVEIHGANGYLLDQFLTSYTNERQDAWGGAIDKRIQLHVAVVRAVREAVAPGVPVGVRISQGKVNDYVHKWANGKSDAEAVFGTLAASGVDFIHVTEFEAWKGAFAEPGPSLVELARSSAPGVRIIANGNLHLDQRADQVLSAGADIIAMGRGALANPSLPKLMAAGAELANFEYDLLSPLGKIKETEVADK